jgi:hypothetical protein
MFGLNNGSLILAFKPEYAGKLTVEHIKVRSWFAAEVHRVLHALFDMARPVPTSAHQTK